MKAVVAFLLLSCLAISAAWHCQEGPKLRNAKQIDAGAGLVVSTTRIHFAYMLVNGFWIRLSTIRVRHVTVGKAGIWAAGKFNKVYRYLCGRLRHAKGKSMKQVDAGGHCNIVGVTPTNQANCLRKQHAMAFNGNGALFWKVIRNRFRTMKYISTTFNGRSPSWGVLSNHKVVCSQVSNSKTCIFSSWKIVKGLLTMVEVGNDGTVVGVTKIGKVVQRLGISRRFPHGTSWKYVPMCMAIRHVTYDVGNLWAVSRTGLIFKCRI